MVTIHLPAPLPPSHPSHSPTPLTPSTLPLFHPPSHPSTPPRHFCQPQVYFYRRSRRDPWYVSRIRIQIRGISGEALHREDKSAPCCSQATIDQSAPCCPRATEFADIKTAPSSSSARTQHQNIISTRGPASCTVADIVTFDAEFDVARIVLTTSYL